MQKFPERGALADPVLESVRHAIAQVVDNVDARRVTLEARFVEDLGMDSLDLVQMWMELEPDFSASRSMSHRDSR
jgi:acyl carrier protein